MKGHLRLVAEARQGTTFLREQSFSAPMHISKPFVSGDALVVNIVNPTAGLFARDTVELSAEAEPGASLVLTAPSASRIHTSTGGESVFAQTIRVRQGGVVEMIPEYLIPQKGSCYTQRTEFEVEQGGHLIAFETLAPGRVASGEAFLFETLEFRTDVRYGRDLIFREGFRLSLSDESLWPLKRVFPQAYYSSCLAVGPAFEGSADMDLPEIEGLLAGTSRFVKGGWGIKMLARDSIVMRQALRTVRSELYNRLGKAAPSLRRNS